MFPRPWPASYPLSGRMVIVLCLTVMLVGLIGHDPWKTDDVISLSIARSVAQGHWLVPKMAGEAWLNSPPLYYWLAAICGTIFGPNFIPLLEWHDAARLASLLLVAVGLTAIAYATRCFSGHEAGRVAPLLVIGTLGTLVPFHDAQPVLVTFAGLSIALAALAAWQKHPHFAGVGMGLALAVAFLGGGLDSLGLLLVILLACGIHRHWRQQSAKTWLLATAIAVPLVAIWPVLLFKLSPVEFQIWWSQELLALQAPLKLEIKRFAFLVWGLWPVLPFAVWSVWVQRKQLADPAAYLGLIATLVSLIFFLRSRDVAPAILPLIAALAILGMQTAHRLRRGAAGAFDWFGVTTLTLFIALAWLGGIAILTNLPEPIAKNFRIPAPGFVPHWSWPAFSVAVIATLAWLRLIFSAPRSPWRPISGWASGVAVMWVLLGMLWLPWIDYTKSYRKPSAELRRAIGQYDGCIERDQLGTVQRASFDYFDNIRTTTIHPGDSVCRLRIVQAVDGDEKKLSGWRMVTETARPGEKRERLRLYRRITKKSD
jgi:4-amino-4-deoxy-L-arabinose transferase-like glycosyltransferase